MGGWVAEWESPAYSRGVCVAAVKERTREKMSGGYAASFSSKFATVSSPLPLQPDTVCLEISFVFFTNLSLQLYTPLPPFFGTPKSFHAFFFFTFSHFID